MAEAEKGGMTTSRLEAFSDGVIAIIITIMVLELRVPHEPQFQALGPLWPVILSYLLSFINLGIYWNNHHHLLNVTRQVDGVIMWANLHLLFWLSLVPFTTAWMGENRFAPTPTAVYGVVLFMASIAYFILAKALMRREGANSPLARALGRDKKGKVSSAIYLAAIPLAFVHQIIAQAMFVLVAVMWLIPDPRIEEMVVPEGAAD